MSFDSAIHALSSDALKLVKNNQIIGLGSGRAATTFVKLLGKYITSKKLNIWGVPTSLQIKIIAQENKIPLINTDEINAIDIIFDGADQIDYQNFIVKGGGGALLRENILASCAKKVVIMADQRKFVKNINMPIPVEVNPHARNTVISSIQQIGGIPTIRVLDRGYPFFTENGNIILDCSFGVIKNPRQLAHKIIHLAGVMEVGIFTKKPDIIYKAKPNGKFSVITTTTASKKHS